MKLLIQIIAILFLTACGEKEMRHKLTKSSNFKIVSLDFCADQFVLALVDRENILALSPDAEKSFSYLKNSANGIPTIKPIAEDILLLKPDIVVRTYGGGPNANAFFERVGINVIQIDFTTSLADIRYSIIKTANELDQTERGQKIVATMDRRLARVQKNDRSPSALYVTSKGAIAGQNTIINELMEQAGFNNFQSSRGWSTLPLERLAYEQPDIIATGFFETSDRITDIWTPARHPVAKRLLKEVPIVKIPGALTACNSWSLIDAVDLLSQSKIEPAQ